VRAGDLDQVEIAFDHVAKLGDALFEKEVDGELQILGRHRGAVREGHVVAQVQHHPVKAFGVFDRGA
jgi:hypothetical protein